MRKNDLKWLKHINVFGVRGDSIQHLPSGPIGRLRKAGFVEINPAHNPSHYDRATITDNGVEELSVGDSDE